jgi:hypothetical protein
VPLADTATTGGAGDSNGACACAGSSGVKSCNGEANESRGHVEVTEVAAAGVWLAVYGDAAEHFDKAPRSVDTVGASFAYHPFDRIAHHSIPKLKKLRRLRELHFDHTELHSLHQLHSLGLLPSLTALRISPEGNPVVAHPHFHSLVISLLPLLRSLNGVAVLAEDRETAERQWRRLRRLYGLAGDGLHSQLAPLSFQHAMQVSDPYRPVERRDLEDTAGERSRASDREDASSSEAAQVQGVASTSTTLATAFVNRVVDHALTVDNKIAQLNVAWPRIVSRYHERVRADVRDRAMFLQRYQAATRGDTARTTLAMLE